MNGTGFRVVADAWEEHCVECGAPACYASCPRFEATGDGRCRRFEKGIETASDGKSMRVRFRAWGKLELLFRGRMARPAVARVAAAWDRWAWSRGGGFARRRKLRNALFGKYVTVLGAPETWTIEATSASSADFVASIFFGDEVVFEKRLKFAPGPNSFSFAVPKVGKYARFRLFPLGEQIADLTFTRLELACGAARASAPAKFLKCVAWDLDNTFWDGILSEDGADGVRVRPEALAAVKALDARGILNTVVSKNDFAPAWDKLKALGVEEYFVFPEINWGPKSESIARAAKAINMGVDTFAFVDDSAHERGEVAANLPMVRVFAENEIARLLADPAANPETSAESAKRRFSYLAEMRRRTDAAEMGGDPREFLKSCGIVLTLGRLSSPTLFARCRELVQRTNQLTLAGRRYSEEEFRAFVERPDVSAYAVHCRDKYGDYGVVGFIAVSESSGGARVAEFVMSCRVAKKLCEQSVLLFVAANEPLAKGKMLSAEVVPTGRNKALVEAFDAMPFACGTRPDGARTYSLAPGADLSGTFTNAVRFGEIAL